MATNKPNIVIVPDKDGNAAFAMSHSDGVKVKGKRTLTEELFDTVSAVLSNEVSFFKHGRYLKPDGDLHESSGFMVSRLIDLRNMVSLSTTDLKSASSYRSGVYYDASGDAIASPVISVNGSLTIVKDDIPEGAAFVRFNYDESKSPTVTLVTQKDWRHSDEKSEVLESVLFDKNTSTISGESGFFDDGFYINSNGTLSEGSAYKVSRLIDIRNTTELSTTDLKSGSSFKGAAFYGSDGAPISQSPTLNINGTHTFVASDFPKDAAYIRFNYLASSEPIVKQVTSENWRNTRDDVNKLEKEVNDLHDEMAEEKTDVLSGESGFFENGFYINSNGTLTESPSYKVSRLIDVKMAESVSSTNVFTGQSSRGVAFYDANKLPIQVDAQSGNVTINKASFPPGTVYVRFNYQTAATPTVEMKYNVNPAYVNYRVEQIEKDYVKHGELDDSQLVEIVQSIPPVSGFGVDASGSLVNAGLSSLPFYIGDAKKINVTEIATISAQVPANMSFFDSDMQYLGKIDVPSSNGARSAEIQSSDFPTGSCFVVVRFGYDTGTLKKTCNIKELDRELTNAYRSMYFSTAENGYIKYNDGTFVKSANERCIRDILVDGELLINPKERIPSGTSDVASMCYYDKNGEYMSAVQSVDYSVPVNAAYASMTWTATGFGEGVSIYFVKYKRSTSKQVLTLSALRGHVRTLEERLYTGLVLEGKAVFLGDSITEGYGSSGFPLYHDVFSDFSGMEKISLGIHANTYGKRPDDIGQIYEQVANQNFPNDAKLVSIFAGTNDFGHNVEIGDLFEVDASTGMKGAPSTTLTVAGGLHKTILDIQAKVPLARIVIMTPLPRYYTSIIASSSRHANDIGKYLKDYADAIKEIAAFYGIPVLDLFTMSNIDPHNATIAQTYYSDGYLHLNGLGHQVVGHLLFKFVRDNLVFD